MFDLEKKLAHALLEKKMDDELLQVLTEDMALLKKRFFSEKSERRAATQGKKPKRNKGRLLHNQRPIDNDLATAYCSLVHEEIIHTEIDVAERDEDGNDICPCGAGLLLPMHGAFEESGEIDVEDRVYTLKRHKRQKCKCNSCGRIMAAKGPQKLTPGSQFSVAMAVQVADDKFHHHLPLNRQCEMMAARGLDVGARTLYALTEHLLKLLEEIPVRRFTPAAIIISTRALWIS